MESVDFSPSSFVLLLAKIVRAAQREGLSFRNPDHQLPTSHQVQGVANPLRLRRKVMASSGRKKRFEIFGRFGYGVQRVVVTLGDLLEDSVVL